MSEWIDVLEDVPQVEKGYTNVSVTVRVMLSNGKVIDAFYGYHQDTWYNANNGNPIHKYKYEVVAWQSK